MEDDVREGFLCPFCFEDMGTMNRLRTHFQKEHSNEPKINQFLREFYGRAKEIVNKGDSDAKTTIRKEVLYSLDIYNTPQELGVTRSHMEKFIEMRNRRLEGFAAETNKLIIRLDKLLINLPSDPSKRRLHEQTIVPWIETEDVSRCPECTKMFHLARRKHHCRLCGGIMCHDCSCFLPISKAKDILSYQSETSHNSEANDETSFRICQYCLNLLENRESMKASRNCKPNITELYDVMRSYVKDLDEKAEMYGKMSESLNEGKVTYHLSDAKDLWGKMMKLSERISAMSTKIASLNVAENADSLTDKQLKLQKAVSSGINGYIQSKIISLRPLPSDEEYNRLKEERSRMIENKIRRERQEDMTDALLASQVTTEVIHGNSRTPQQRTHTTPTVDRGWVPETGTSRFNLVDDPLIEQMNNIRSFIKQAREACRYDEVKKLEDHLKELKEEFYHQQSRSNPDRKQSEN